MAESLLSIALLRLAKSREPTIGWAELEGHPSSELKTLLRMGILRAIEDAAEITRPSRLPPGPPLVVRRTSRGIFGVAEEGDYHEPIPLTEEEIRQYEVVESEVVDQIRKANPLQGVPTQVERGFHLLGELKEYGRSFRVYLAVPLPREADIQELATRLYKPDSHSVLLSLAGITLRLETEKLLSQLGLLVIPILQHISAESLALNWSDLIQPELLEPSIAPIPPDAYCRILAGHQDQFASRQEFDEIMGRVAEFDIFVNGLNQTCHGLPSRKSQRKCSIELSETERDLLVEYIQARRELRIVDTRVGKRIDPTSALKAFEQARKKIDKKITGKTSWVCFRMTKGAMPRDKSFRFDPPADVTYCLIAPLPIRPETLS